MSYYEDVECVRENAQKNGQFVLGNVSYFKEKIDLLEFLFSHDDNVIKNGLEIGTNCGHSAALFLDALPDAKLVSFDIGDRQYILDAVAILEEKTQGRFTFVKGDSKVSVPNYLADNDVMFDYVLIDGDHTYLSVKSDLLNTTARVTPGGVVVIDDLDVPEIFRAVKEHDWSEFTLLTTVLSLRYTKDKVSCMQVYQRNNKRSF